MKKIEVVARALAKVGSDGMTTEPLSERRISDTTMPMFLISHSFTLFVFGIPSLSLRVCELVVSPFRSWGLVVQKLVAREAPFQKVFAQIEQKGSGSVPIEGSQWGRIIKREQSMSLPIGDCRLPIGASARVVNLVT